MKPFELRGLTDDELKTKLHEHSEELFSLRFRKSIGELPDSSRVGKLKKEIARLRTILRERELGKRAAVKGGE